MQTVNIEKHLKEEDLDNAIKKIRSEKKKIVFTNGCFDIIHSGHIIYLKQAKKMGDYLILGLNSDKSIHRIKGKDRPIIFEKDRLIVLSSIQFIDYIIVFDEDTPYNLIKSIKPDILVKGGDWKVEDIVGADIVASYNGEVKSIPYLDGMSTTNIINRILKVYGGNQNERD